jgi:thiamine-phosphate pyrophosphorylase
VTDRRAFAVPGEAQEEQCAAVFAKIAVAASAGVDWIQIREKDMDGGKLAELTQKVISQVGPKRRVILNERLDIACAVGAAGVHLGEKSIPVAEAWRFVRERRMSKEFLIGTSVHSLELAVAAEKDGADYVIFGPVFATPSKVSFGPPQGLERLAAVCQSVSIPVLAIGGITAENAQECYAQGASGIAAIRLFQETGKIETIVKQLRGSN